MDTAFFIPSLLFSFSHLLRTYYKPHILLGTRTVMVSKVLLTQSLLSHDFFQTLLLLPVAQTSSSLFECYHALPIIICICLIFTFHNSQRHLSISATTARSSFISFTKPCSLTCYFHVSFHFLITQKQFPSIASAIPSLNIFFFEEGCFMLFSNCVMDMYHMTLTLDYRFYEHRSQIVPFPASFKVVSISLTCWSTNYV